MTKIVFNKEHDDIWIKNSAVRRYFEILAELNPTKKYDYELKADLSPSVISDLDWYYSGEVTHLLNGEFWWCGEIPRDCPALVRLVEETGGKCVREGQGQAVIAEIPDDVEWEIFSWDNGREEIHEKHRSWSFNAEQNQVVCYDDRERKIEQIDIAIQLIGDAINNLMSANNLLKLNAPSRTEQVMQSLLELAETLKEEEALTKES